MSLNIIDLAKNYITPELISKTASQLGESESGVSKAISGLLPTILGGVAQNGVSGGMLDSLKSLATSGVLNSLTGGGESNSMLSGIITSIFGDKLSGILSGISSFAGIKDSSASSLMNLASGAALGSLGKHAVDNNLDASSFGGLLESQKSNISAMLPAGLGALGLGAIGGGLGSMASSVTGGLGDVAGKVGGAASAVTGGLGNVAGKVGGAVSGGLSGATSGMESPKGGGSFLKWLLPLLILAGLAFFAFKKCGKKEGETNNNGTEMTTDSTASAETDSMDAASNTTTGDNAGTGVVAVESTKVKLPSGAELNANKGGIEEQLVSFLGTGEYKTASEEVLKTKWFSFDNLNFVFGKTELTPESKVQIDNLVAILKEYKDVKVKVGAYTDRVGSDTGNKALSQKRADAVKTALTNAGVGSQVTAAEGYGESMAKVDEKASDEERKADRKTAIRIVK